MTRCRRHGGSQESARYDHRASKAGERPRCADRTSADSKVLPSGFERNLLCCIADATGRYLGLAIIDHIDFAGGTMALTTTVDRDKLRIVQFGDVYVTPEGGELGQIKWAW